MYLFSAIRANPDSYRDRVNSCHSFHPLKYLCETKTLELVGYRLEILEIKDSDSLFEQLLALGPDHADVRDERIPYWAEIWPSAVALATHLLKGPTLAGRHVMEIGCGLGLPGIAAGLKGAEVMFTDYLEEPLSFAKQNWKQNLDREATFQLLDWRNPPPGLKAEIVLASDVAYEQKAFEPLLSFFQKAIAPGRKILLSQPGRKYATTLFDTIDAASFDRYTCDYPVTLKGITTPVKVDSLTPPG